MSKSLYVLAITAAFTGLWIGAQAFAQTTKPTTAPSTAPTTKHAALNFTVKNIDNKDVDLATYSGKVIMMVNVASKCGNTPQYAGLEKIYSKYKDKGFVIMGFPANNFGGQEPGSNEQIMEFCTSTYHVEFPMFSKVSVKGNDIAPLFKYLTAQDCKPISKGDVAWNFEKFLISKNGTLVGRFGNRTQPEDPTVITAIEAEIAK